MQLKQNINSSTNPFSIQNNQQTMTKKDILLIITILLLQTNGYGQKKQIINFQTVTSENKIWGIDVSHHQSDIDWKSLLRQKPHFIFFKATEGASIKDSKYEENYYEARNYGIIVGSYHFFSYRSSGVEQANNFLKVAKYKSGDLPLVIDAEYSRKMPSKKVVTKELTDFMKIITRKTGKKPIVYCDYDFYIQYLKGNLKNKHYLWICDYRQQPECDWTFWQTTDKFEIQGVKGRVDLNIFNGTRADLKALLF